MLEHKARSLATFIHHAQSFVNILDLDYILVTPHLQNLGGLSSRETRYKPSRL